MGLLREGVAAQILFNLGATLEKVRREMGISTEFSNEDIEGIREMEISGKFKKQSQKELEGLPEQTIREAMELQEQIDRFNEEKEEAVANQDFYKAAVLRDKADKLKKKRDKIIRQGQEKRKHN